MVSLGFHFHRICFFFAQGPSSLQKFQAASLNVAASSRSTLPLPKLRRFRQSLQVYRHDLLVAMRVVNRVEHELYQAQLEEWVRRELQACDGVADIIQLNKTTDFVRADDFKKVKAGLQSYCDSCREVMLGSYTKDKSSW